MTQTEEGYVEEFLEEIQNRLAETLGDFMGGDVSVFSDERMEGKGIVVRLISPLDHPIEIVCLINKADLETKKSRIDGDRHRPLVFPPRHAVFNLVTYDGPRQGRDVFAQCQRILYRDALRITEQILAGARGKALHLRAQTPGVSERR